MKVVFIQMVIGILGMIPKGLGKRVEELKIKAKNIQTTALLKSAKILKWTLDIWGEMLELI